MNPSNIAKAQHTEAQLYAKLKLQRFAGTTRFTNRYLAQLHGRVPTFHDGIQCTLCTQPLSEAALFPGKEQGHSTGNQEHAAVKEPSWPFVGGVLDGCPRFSPQSAQDKENSTAHQKYPPAQLPETATDAPKQPASTHTSNPPAAHECRVLREML
ncbi:hypothetical protein CBR_g26186 [Chara braunii]|uniref:Uncharacterized protein n=1 Tax=Chara braunii TaxID=69332 RepID=A0A388L753_CHABU|nr:hypothetical protein CBR_g26186 [Chara braunii]|eukprot:GBG78151.1 hypothetical protein CBR_g26186 [Chara braunii]